MMARINYLCDCGSDAILADAWVQWDIESQTWVLVDDNAGGYWCRDCDTDVKYIKTEVIKENE